MKDRYIFPAIFSFDSDGISVEYPDLPGCLTCGKTEEEAILCAKEALEIHLYGMENDNDFIPEPSKISNIRLEKNQTIIIMEAWMPLVRNKMKNVK